jgi:hypothetical protein
VNQKITHQPPLNVAPDSLPPADLPCPVWVSMAVYFFRLGIGVFLALSLLLSGCAVNAAEDFWQPATTVLTPDQLRVIIAEHSTFTINSVPPTWIEQAQVHMTGNLMLINFNQSGLCGQAGCLYVGYVQDDASTSLNLVLYGRFRTDLPRGVPLFEEMEQSLNGLPCLTAHQIENQQLQAIAFCFDGTQYQQQSSVVIDAQPKAAGDRVRPPSRSEQKHERHQH